MDDPLRITPLSPSRWRAEVPATMAQGRAAFGGLLAGLGLRAADTAVDVDRAPRSVMVDFIAPVEAGEVEIGILPLRSGRALSHVEIRIHQRGQLAMIAAVAYGMARPTRLARPAAPAPPIPPDGSLSTLPYIEGVTPAFTQHFEYRWTRGAFPFSGAATDGFGGLIRPRARVRVDAAVVLSLLDGWPCPMLPRADRVIPASSVTWLVNFVRAVPEAPPDAWWQVESDAVASADGYVDADAKIWGPDGALVATSRQLMVEFSG